MTRSLVVRLALAASVCLASPALAGGVATLRTAGTEASVDARGRLVSLKARGGMELLSSTAVADLFALELEQDGAPVTVGASQAGSVQVTSPTASSVRIVYTGVGAAGLDVTVTARSAPKEPLLLWRIGCRLPVGVRLTRVHFPVVALEPRTEGRDAWVSGATKGGLHPSPSAWQVGRSHYVSQPGSLAAAFACYYAAHGGYTTQARDVEGHPRAVGIGRTATALDVRWLTSCWATGRWSPDIDFAMGAFQSTRGFVTDWRDAADLYKVWALRQPWCARTFDKRTDLPAWLRQGPAMVRFHRGWLADPASIDRWMKDYWRARFPRMPLITAYWGWEKVETWVTPDYFPAFPSDARFRALVARNRALGAHAFLWPSGYHYTLTFGKQADGSLRWDDRARFDAVARPHAVVERSGKTLIGDRGWLEGGQTATLCPGDLWTRRWFDAISVSCAQRGADMVQVDQVVGGAFPACWNPSHGHPVGPGPWMTEVFHAQLTSMAAATRQALPGSVVCFEEPNERFLQQVGIQDYRDWEVVGQGGAEPASVFNYLYHEYVPTFQSNPRQGDLLQASWCLVTGQMPHLMPDRRVGPGPALANGAFEEGGAEAPSGWDKVGGYQGEVWSGRCDLDAQERHGGRASLRLTNGPGQTVQVSQNVPVAGAFAAGRRYRLSAWVKGGGAQSGNALMVGCFAEGMKPTWSGSIALPSEPGGWVQGASDFTLPEGSRVLRVMLHLRGEGTVWIDDVQLAELRPDGSAAPVLRSPFPADHAFMRRWVDLYHGEGRPYLALGRTLQRPALQCERVDSDGWRRPSVLHNAYQAPDGSQAAILVNASDAPRACRLNWQGRRFDLRLAPWEARLVRGKEKAQRR
jgi:hypothetical protein